MKSFNDYLKVIQEGKIKKHLPESISIPEEDEATAILKKVEKFKLGLTWEDYRNAINILIKKMPEEEKKSQINKLKALEEDIPENEKLLKFKEHFEIIRNKVGIK